MTSPAAPSATSPTAADPTAVVGARVGQHILDSVLLFVAALVVMGVGGGAAALLMIAFPRAGWAGVLSGVAIVVALLIAVAGSWLLNAWWPHRHGGRTPAMGWLKLRIVGLDGGPAGLGALTIRWALLIVDGLCSGLVGLIVMLCTERHQRVGDLAARTLVIRAD
jgi:uncharacterized RDD family membrane protein YckC